MINFIKRYIKRFSIYELVELIAEVFNVLVELGQGFISLISAVLMVFLYPLIIIGEVLDVMESNENK